MREAWLVLLGVLLTIWQCFNREIFTLPHNGGACWQTCSHMGSDKPVPCCWLLLFILTPLWYRIKIAKPKPGPARFVLSSRRCRLLPVASGNTRRPRPGPGPGPGPDPGPAAAPGVGQRRAAQLGRPRTSAGASEAVSRSAPHKCQLESSAPACSPGRGCSARSQPGSGSVRAQPRAPSGAGGAAGFAFWHSRETSSNSPSNTPNVAGPERRG